MNMKLWIGNIEPGTTDEEIREFVKKYAPDLECTKIQPVEGDGSRPAAMLEFADTPYGSVEKISMRLSGMYWKGASCWSRRWAVERARRRILPPDKRCVNGAISLDKGGMVMASNGKTNDGKGLKRKKYEATLGERRPSCASYRNG